MRLKRLDLTRYGNFTGRSIEFGEKQQGLPDLHIVYGPNEAGKSTALAAFLDLLFGIGTQSPFGFLHPYPTMRVGGLIEVGAEARELVRIKRPQNSLLDADDRPIAENVIRGELGGVDRESYRTMFSLDDETLEKGGESILASKGDLGELLFSASAGLADLSRRLLDLRAGAEGFYKYRARSGILAELKTRLAELKAERERFDTQASDYARLIDIRDRASSQYDEAIGERTRIQARVDEIQRHLAALPRLAALRAIRERLQPLAELPAPPPVWSEELPKLQKEEIELGVQTRAVADEIERLGAEIDSIVIDEPALRLLSKVEQLADLRARHVTAEKDIPERRLQLQAAELAVSGILTRMEREGEADPRRLLLGASTVGRLRELVESRSGIDSAIRTAATELTDARRRLTDAEALLREAGDDPKTERGRDGAIARLTAAMAASRNTDHVARRRLAERARETAITTLTDRLRTLHPWRGEVEDLVGMRCLSGDAIQQWKTALDNAQRELRQHVNDVDRLTSEIRRLEAERDAIAGMTGIVSDQEAAAIRTHREQAWSAHRRHLEATSADAFESALRHDDIVTSSRQAHMSDLAKLHQTGQSLAIAAAELTLVTELKDAAAAAVQSIREKIATAVRTMATSFADDVTLTDVEDWLARRDKALEAREAILAAEQDLREAKADAQEAHDRLKAALDGAGLSYDAESGFDGLLTAAQVVLDREGETRALRVATEERKRELLLRERAAEQANADEQAWTASWTTACKACWLGDQAEIPTLATVREILSAAGDLGPALEKKVGLVDRIEKMEKDQVSFRDEVAAICGDMAIPVGSNAVLDLAQRVGDRVRDAVAERARRTKTTDSLEEARKRNRLLAETLAVHEQQKQTMTSFFSVGSLAEVAGKLLDVAKRRELRQHVEDAEHEILEAMRLSDITEAGRILDTADRPALEAELIELKARFDDQDRRCHELFATRSQAIDQVEAIGGDSKVAEIEERRRTTLLEIQDGAERYLQLRAGTVAMEQALRAYRERHRSSMMTRASAAFRTVSRGAYSGLAAQPGKDGETLIALSEGGGSKSANELSKGTRFQLYLALRVAGYHEFVRARCPVPFIADDIMETFDDFRAEEAFRLFADMAGVGQVIYLTHHQHLCDIAKKVCPDARLHRIGTDQQE
ncbi:AAA family ATPase [Bradyrhizobium quebecense]|uniref:AAA family ATPase n=1 Tax=Bradyrhizobium quebecense TaxID=2748629 RepID=A0A974AHF9_9BRAD|nr:AAA family ATPase [Bradyrhizobium quebecense]UGA43047.1 AAA family ATPase [Bradyrhizobium quebecense]